MNQNNIKLYPVFQSTDNTCLSLQGFVNPECSQQLRSLQVEFNTHHIYHHLGLHSWHYSIRCGLPKHFSQRQRACARLSPGWTGCSAPAARTGSRICTGRRHHRNTHLYTLNSYFQFIIYFWILSSIFLKCIYLDKLFVSPFTGNQKNQGD